MLHLNLSNKFIGNFVKGMRGVCIVFFITCLILLIPITLIVNFFDNGNKCNCWTFTKSDINDVCNHLESIHHVQELPTFNTNVSQLNAFSPIKNHINELFNYAHPHQYGKLATETLKYNPYQSFNNKKRHGPKTSFNESNNNHKNICFMIICIKDIMY
jgi:hypothetical protein